MNDITLEGARGSHLTTISVIEHVTRHSTVTPQAEGAPVLVQLTKHKREGTIRFPVPWQVRGTVVALIQAYAKESRTTKSNTTRELTPFTEST